MHDIPMSTTDSIAEYHVTKTLGVIHAHAVYGTNMLKDIAAQFRDTFGGRAKGYEDTLAEGTDAILAELARKAVAAEADGLVGVSIDVEHVGSANRSMLMIAGSGTAVRFREQTSRRDP